MEGLVWDEGSSPPPDARSSGWGCCWPGRCVRAALLAHALGAGRRDGGAALGRGPRTGPGAGRGPAATATRRAGADRTARRPGAGRPRRRPRADRHGHRAVPRPPALRERPARPAPLRRRPGPGRRHPRVALGRADRQPRRRRLPRPDPDPQRLDRAAASRPWSSPASGCAASRPRRLPPPGRAWIVPALLAVAVAGAFVLLASSTELGAPWRARPDAASRRSGPSWRARVQTWRGAIRMARPTPWPAGAWGAIPARSGAGPARAGPCPRRSAPRCPSRRTTCTFRRPSRRAWSASPFTSWHWGRWRPAASGRCAQHARRRGLPRALPVATLSLLAGQGVDALASPSYQFAEVSLLFWAGLGLGLAAVNRRGRRRGGRRPAARRCVAPCASAPPAGAPSPSRRRRCPSAC